MASLNSSFVSFSVYTWAASRGNKSCKQVFSTGQLPTGSVLRYAAIVIFTTSIIVVNVFMNTNMMLTTMMMFTGVVKVDLSYRHGNIVTLLLTEYYYADGIRIIFVVNLIKLVLQISWVAVKLLAVDTEYVGMCEIITEVVIKNNILNVTVRGNTVLLKLTDFVWQ